MAGWFRQGLSPHHTALAMIGAKAGDRVVFLGADDPDLIAEVARVTGLNGQTAVFDPRAGAQTGIETAAGNAGTLIEFEHTVLSALPVDAGARDVSVVLAPLATLAEHDRAAVLREATRVLRTGGRVVIVDGTRRGGLLSVLQPKSPRLPSGVILALLDGAGAKARRQLAETDGVAYYEGRKT